MAAANDVSSIATQWVWRSPATTLSWRLKTVQAAVATTNAASHHPSLARKSRLGAHHVVVRAAASAARTESPTVSA